jgi:uncharacterized membrane protein
MRKKISNILYTLIALVIIILCYQFANISNNDIGIWKFICGIIAGFGIAYPLTFKNKK